MHSQKFIERFFSKTMPVTESGCLIWLGFMNTTGYGNVRVHPRGIKKAHRVAWEIEHGEIPKGFFVCHKCDTPLCVRVEHLFLGSPQENMTDMVKKERWKGVVQSGESNGNATLTEELVREIKAKLSSNTNIKLAKEYGVTHSMISRIRLGKAWKGVSIETIPELH